MKPLPPPPSAPGAIVSFDFDGTLHHASARPPVPSALFDCLRELRAEHRVVWGINTGRSLGHMIEGIAESGFPFLPDWVVAREREIYFADAAGRWLPHTAWNHRCEQAIHGLFAKIRPLLAQLRRHVEMHGRARWFDLDGEPAGFVSDNEDEMEEIMERIVPVAAQEPMLGWQRNSIYLRFGHRHFHKGSSLSEVARVYQVDPGRCFAMGDAHNDIEMLDAAHSGMSACPANALPIVRRHVEERGGLVTRAVHGLGALEALDHYFPRRKSGLS